MASNLLALTQTATGLRRPVAPLLAPAVMPAPAVSRPEPGSIPWRAEGRTGATSPGDGPTPAKRIDLHEEIRLSEVVGAMSQALDLAEGQALGHAARTCLIGIRIGSTLGLSPEHRSALYYALLLKDLGGSVNSAPLAALFGTDDHVLKRVLKLTNWTTNEGLGTLSLQARLPGRARPRAEVAFADARETAPRVRPRDDGRPYRSGLPLDEVSRILQREVRSGRLCADAVAAGWARLPGCQALSPCHG